MRDSEVLIGRVLVLLQFAGRIRLAADSPVNCVASRYCSLGGWTNSRGPNQLGYGSTTQDHNVSGWESGEGSNVQGFPGPGKPGVWRHVALSFDGTNQWLHADGALLAKTPAAPPGPFVPGRKLFIGMSQRKDDLRVHAKGLIRSIRVSSIARYANEFTPAENWQTDTNTLLLLDSRIETKEVAKDLSGNGYDAKLFGAKWVSTTAAKTNHSAAPKPAEDPAPTQNSAPRHCSNGMPTTAPPLRRPRWTATFSIPLSLISARFLFACTGWIGWAGRSSTEA